MLQERVYSWIDFAKAVAELIENGEYRRDER